MNKRREFLAGIGGAVGVSVAGCLASGSTGRQLDPERTPDQGAWPSQHYTPANNRYNPHVDHGEASAKRTISIQNTLFHVVTNGDTVFGLTTFLGQAGGNLYAWDASDGTEKWSHTGLDSIGALTYADGRVYVGGASVNALAADSGETIFETDVPSGYVYSILEARGTIYVGTGTGLVCGLNADTGAIRWKQNHGASSHMAVYDGAVLASSSQGVVEYASERSSLRSIQNKPPKHRAEWSLGQGGYETLAPAVVDGVAYRGCYATGPRTAVLVAHDLEQDTNQFTRKLGDFVYTPAVNPQTQRAYTVARDVGPSAMSGRLYALETETGETVWSEDIDIRSGPPVLAGDTVYLAGRNGGAGHLVGFGVESGELRFRRQFSGDLFSQPLAVTSDRVYTGGAGNVSILEF